MDGEIVVIVQSVRVRLRVEELRAFELMAEGLTYRQIGGELGLSRHGVRKLVCSVCDKTGAVNRVAALTLLLREGVLPGA